MTVNFNAAIQAYQQAAKQGAAGAGPSSDTGGDFASMLGDAVKNVGTNLKAGENAAIEGVAGNADLTQVVTAVSNAELTLQTVVAVRDRVVQAYQEIIRMPI